MEGGKVTRCVTIEKTKTPDASVTVGVDTMGRTFRSVYNVRTNTSEVFQLVYASNGAPQWRRTTENVRFSK